MRALYHEVFFWLNCGEWLGKEQEGCITPVWPNANNSSDKECHHGGDMKKMSSRYILEVDLKDPGSRLHVKGK